MEWIEERLRSLGRISPPASLRSKLAAGIPQGADRGVETSIGHRRLRWFSYVGAAAAVILVVSILRFQTPLRPAQGPIIDTNDGLSHAASADHNSLAAVDMNVSDEHYLH